MSDRERNEAERIARFARSTVDCYNIIPPHEARAIENAANFAFHGRKTAAERWRKYAGYDGLGND